MSDRLTDDQLDAFQPWVDKDAVQAEFARLSDDQLDAIEATVLGPDGNAYGDDVLALLAEVRALRDTIDQQNVLHSKEVGELLAERDEAVEMARHYRLQLGGYRDGDEVLLGLMGMEDGQP